MTTAIYAGSFDPITTGHLSVIRQASRLFGHVIVLVAGNPLKDKGMFTFHERIGLIEQSVKMLKNVSADYTHDLVVEYAQQNNATILVRGLRGVSDVDSEMKLAQVNKALAPEISTVLLPADAILSEVSSSELKKRAKEGKSISTYCLPHVVTLVKEKINANSISI